MVTLCPYVVGALRVATMLGRLAEVSAADDGALVPLADDGFALVERA